MDEEDRGRGTELYRRDRRRRGAAFIVSLVIAGLAACAVAYALNRAEALLEPLDPILALGLLLFFAGSFAAANWLYLRHSDELVWEDNIRASFWALAFLVLLYPAWLLLHAAALLPPPSAKGIWGGTIAAAGLVYLWRRLRSR